MAISQKKLLRMKKWRLILIQLPEGEHNFTLETKNDCDSFKQTIMRENRKMNEFVYTFNALYKEGKALVTKRRRA